MNREQLIQARDFIPVYLDTERVLDLAAFLVEIKRHISDDATAEHLANVWHEKGGYRHDGHPLVDVDHPRYDFGDDKPTVADEHRYLAKELRGLPLAEAATAICSPAGPVAQLRARREVMVCLMAEDKERRRLASNARQRQEARMAQQQGRITKLRLNREARALCFLADHMASDSTLATTVKRDPAALVYALARALLTEPAEFKVEGYNAIHDFAVTAATAAVFGFAPLTEVTTDPLDGVD